MKMFRSATAITKLAFAVAFLSLLSLVSVRFVQAAWAPPTSAPPGGNTAAPLNVSGVSQTKQGSLTIGGEYFSLSGGDVLFAADDRGVFWGTASDPTKPHIEFAGNNLYISPGETGVQTEIQGDVRISMLGLNAGSLVLDNTENNRSLAFNIETSASGVDIKSFGAPLFLNYDGGQKVQIGSSAARSKLCLNDDGSEDNCIEDWSSGGSYWTQNGLNLYPQDLGWNIGLGTSSPSTRLALGSNVVGYKSMLTIDSLDNNGSNSMGIDWRFGGSVGFPWGPNGSNSRIAVERQGAANTFDMLFFTMNTGTFAEKIRILGNGRVGIGTPTPQRELHVVGNARISGLTCNGLLNGGKVTTNDNGDLVCGDDTGGGGGGDTYMVKTDGTDTANFLNNELTAGTNITLTPVNVGGDLKLQIAASGGGGTSLWDGTEGSAIYPKTPASTKVGIGGSSVPASILQLYPGANTWGADLSLDAAGLAGGRRWLAISTGGTAGEGQGKFLIKDNNASAVRLTIDNGGKVGLGPTDPQNQLEVGNAIGGYQALRRLDPTITSGKDLGALYFTGDDEVTSGIGAQIKGRATADWSGNDYPTKLMFLTSPDGGTAQERMVILENGNVGIGTSAPTAKLEVTTANGTSAFRAGSSSVNSLTIGQSGTGYSGIGYNLSNTATNNTWKYVGRDTASLITFQNGGFIFRGTDFTGEAGNDANLTNLMSIGNTGIVRIPDLLCNGGANGGKVTTNADGDLVCGDDVGGGSGWIGGSGTVNRISKFTAATTIGDSAIYESSGNIGIGAAPGGSHKLEVSGSIFTNADNDLALGNIANVNRLYTGGSNILVYLNSGNGYGNAQFGKTRLGSYFNSDWDSASNNVGWYWNAAYDGANYNYINPAAWGGTAARLAGTGDYLEYSQASGGTNPISWNTRLAINSDGNVGIGAAPNGNKLFVQSAANNYLGYGGDALTLRRGGTSQYPYIQWKDNNDIRGMYLGWGASGSYIDLALENNNNLYISGGKVGIGIQPPTAKLEVTTANGTSAFRAGSSSVNSLTIGQSGTGYSGIGYNLSNTATNNTWKYVGRDTASLITFQNGGFIFRGTDFTGEAGNDVILTNFITVLNTGKTGVANDNPSALLSVSVSGVSGYTANHTITANNINNTAPNGYDAIAGFKGNSGTSVNGSGVYGELVAGSNCTGTCAGIYGSIGGNSGTGEWAGYFDGPVNLGGDLSMHGVMIRLNPCPPKLQPIRTTNALGNIGYLSYNTCVWNDYSARIKLNGPKICGITGGGGGYCWPIKNTANNGNSFCWSHGMTLESSGATGAGNVKWDSVNNTEGYFVNWAVIDESSQSFTFIQCEQGVPPADPF